MERRGPMGRKNCGESESIGIKKDKPREGNASEKGWAKAKVGGKKSSWG